LFFFFIIPHEKQMICPLDKLTNEELQRESVHKEFHPHTSSWEGYP